LLDSQKLIALSEFIYVYSEDMFIFLIPHTYKYNGTSKRGTIMSNCTAIKTKISTKKRCNRKYPYAARGQMEQASRCTIKLPNAR
jgi:hypothetical protein